MGELFSQYNVLGAFGITIALTVLSALGALVIGTLVAIMRVSPVGFLNKLGALYVNLVRNTPLTLIIVFLASLLRLTRVPAPQAARTSSGLASGRA